MATRDLDLEFTKLIRRYNKSKMITYLAINLTNKKFQVGSSIQPEVRIKQHLNSKDEIAFHRSIRRDPDNFYWVIGTDDGLGNDDRSDEQFYLDFYYGSRWCYNINPAAERPPDHTGKTQWKNELTQEQKMCFEKPEGKGWERGTLQEVKKKMSEAQSGEKNYQFNKSGALHNRSKAIIAIQPDGTELHFGSGCEAARELGIGQGHLCGRYLKTGRSPVSGKFKDWRFVYKNP